MKTRISHQANWGWVTVGEVQPLGTPGKMPDPFPSSWQSLRIFSCAPSCFSVQAARFGSKASNQAHLSLDVGFGAEDLAESLPM